MPLEYVCEPELYLKGTKLVKDTLRAECKSREFIFLDFTIIANEYMKRTGTVWSRFALFNDYSHVSAEGSRLLAEEIYKRFNHK